MYNPLIPYFKEKGGLLNITRPLKRYFTLLGAALYHHSLKLLKMTWS
jgi:hypothetical protein